MPLFLVILYRLGVWRPRGRELVRKTVNGILCPYADNLRFGVALLQALHETDENAAAPHRNDNIIRNNFLEDFFYNRNIIFFISVRNFPNDLVFLLAGKRHKLLWAKNFMIEVKLYNLVGCLA